MYGLQQNISGLAENKYWRGCDLKAPATNKHNDRETSDATHAWNGRNATSSVLASVCVNPDHERQRQVVVDTGN